MRESDPIRATGALSSQPVIVPDDVAATATACVRRHCPDDWTAICEALGLTA